MDKIDAAFRLTVGEYRMATYYGLFLRHRRALQILFVVLGTAVLYYLSAVFSRLSPNPLVFLLAAAYLVWGLLLFAGAEKSIRRYLRQPENLIGCEYRVYLESHRLRVEVPERRIRANYNLHNLTACFELSALFLFYTTPQEVYLLPKRALREGDTEALRAELSACLGERFSSRFRKRPGTRGTDSYR